MPNDSGIGSPNRSKSGAMRKKSPREIYAGWEGGDPPEFDPPPPRQFQPRRSPRRFPVRRHFSLTVGGDVMCPYCGDQIADQVEGWLPVVRLIGEKLRHLVAVNWYLDPVIGDLDNGDVEISRSLGDTAGCRLYGRHGQRNIEAGGAGDGAGEDGGFFVRGSANRVTFENREGPNHGGLMLR